MLLLLLDVESDVDDRSVVVDDGFVLLLLGVEEKTVVDVGFVLLLGVAVVIVVGVLVLVRTEVVVAATVLVVCVEADAAAVVDPVLVVEHLVDLVVVRAGGAFVVFLFAFCSNLALNVLTS